MFARRERAIRDLDRPVCSLVLHEVDRITFEVDATTTLLAGGRKQERQRGQCYGYDII